MTAKSLLFIVIAVLLFAIVNQQANAEFSICTQRADQYDPAISGNIVVWTDNRYGTLDIYGYNLATTTEFAICAIDGDQTTPSIHGDIVIWKDNRNGNYDIYG